MGVAKRADHTVGRPLLRGRRPTAVRVHYRDDIQRLALPVQGMRIGGERGQASLEVARVRVHVVRRSEPTLDAPVPGRAVHGSAHVRRAQPGHAFHLGVDVAVRDGRIPPADECRRHRLPLPSSTCGYRCR